jgi:hypothetical protein
MSPTIYEVVCRVPAARNDGRNTASNWGHEHRFHATLESAEASCHRLQAHGGYGSAGVEFSVVERHRSSFSDDEFGHAEWKHACREAGVPLDQPTPAH